ncbi:unnamed protein product [Arabidopsis halleri]
MMIPAEVMAALEPIKDNEEAVKAYGLHLGTEICKKMLAHGIKNVHRPIFWANRPKSYISRTKGWEDFPQGRWGDSRSASYGALSDHQFSRPRARDKKLQQEWVVPLKSVEDTQEKFKDLCLGNLKNSPWSELDGLQPETKIINEQLVKINSKGFLTINSQQSVNTERSDSPTVDEESVPLSL